MAALVTPVTVLLIVVIILTRSVSVSIIYADSFKLRLDLTLFAFTLSKEDNERRRSTAYLSYLSAFRRSIKYILNKSDVEILEFSVARMKMEPRKLASQFHSLALASAIIAYFKREAKSLRVSEDTLNYLVADDSANKYPRINIKCDTHLCFLIIFLVIFLYYTVKRKLRRRKRYDREQNRRYTTRLG